MFFFLSFLAFCRHVQRSSYRGVPTNIRCIHVSSNRVKIQFCILCTEVTCELTYGRGDGQTSLNLNFQCINQNVLMNFSDYVLIHILCRTVKSHRVWTSLYLFSTNWARSSPMLAVSLLCRHVKNLSLGCALYMNSLKLLSELNSKVGAPIHLKGRYTFGNYSKQILT